MLENLQGGYYPYDIATTTLEIEYNLRFFQYVENYYVINDILKNFYAPLMYNKGINLKAVGSPSLDKIKIPAATTITLISDTEESGNGCDNNWFEVEYNGITGYVCSTYLTAVNWDETINNQIEINPFKWDKSYDSDKEYEIEGAYEVFVKNQV